VTSAADVTVSFLGAARTSIQDANTSELAQQRHHAQCAVVVLKPICKLLQSRKKRPNFDDALKSQSLAFYIEIWQKCVLNMINPFAIFGYTISWGGFDPRL